MGEGITRSRIGGHCYAPLGLERLAAIEELGRIFSG